MKEHIDECKAYARDRMYLEQRQDGMYHMNARNGGMCSCPCHIERAQWGAG